MVHIFTHLKPDQFGGHCVKLAHKCIALGCSFKQAELPFKEVNNEIELEDVNNAVEKAMSASKDMNSEDVADAVDKAMDTDENPISGL